MAFQPLHFSPTLQPVPRLDETMETLRQWERQLKEDEGVHARLGQLLRAGSEDDPHAEYLRGWADRLEAAERPKCDLVPLALRGGDLLRHQSISLLPFSSRSHHVPTKRLPQPPLQRESALRPMGLEDLISGAAVKKIDCWLNAEVARLKDMRSHGAASTFPKQKVLIIGQDEFLPDARGIIWDCRPWEYGLPAAPQDFSAPPNSDLDTDFILSEDGGGSFPDQELVGFLVDGVQFKADLPLQFVFGPHLTSLPAGFASVEKEIKRLTAALYYGFHRLFPFVPARFMPQGSTVRKLEPDRWRRTTDGGCPRRDCVDGAGVWAVALNVAIGLKDGCGPEAGDKKWPAQEVKPRIVDAMWDDTILRDMGRTFHEPLLNWSDDVKDYFNTLPLHPSEYWTSCVVWETPHAITEAPTHGGVSFISEHRVLLGSDVEVPSHEDASFISEHRLGFGITIASNVGQRTADLVVSIFERRFDKEEMGLFELILPSSGPRGAGSGICVGGGAADQLTRRGAGYTDQCRWIARRRTLSKLSGRQELRAFAAHMYTDDIRVSVVGIERTVRALRCWRSVTSDMNLVMAIAAKRQIGTSLTWLGFEFFTSHGVVAVQHAKLLRAKADIGQLLGGGQVDFGTFRSLLGLLEHMLVFVGGDRTFMDHMYGDNFRLGTEFGPTTKMVVTEMHKQTLRQWQRVLLKSAGCYFSDALGSAAVAVQEGTRELITSMGSTLFQQKAVNPQIYHLYSDAASETDSGGLGGWVHGEWWHYPVSKDERNLLHITALEFMAVGVNIILYGGTLAGHHVVICADALATVQVLGKGSARAPVMQAIYALITELPEFKALEPLLCSVHVFGEVNVMADAASRDKLRVLHDLSTSIGVAATHVALPPRAFEFISNVKAAAALIQQGRDQVAAAREVELVTQVQVSLHGKVTKGSQAHLSAAAVAVALGTLAGGRRAGMLVGMAAALASPADAAPKRPAMDDPWAQSSPSWRRGNVPPSQEMYDLKHHMPSFGGPPNPWAAAEASAAAPFGEAPNPWAAAKASAAAPLGEAPTPWAAAEATAAVPFGEARNPWAVAEASAASSLRETRSWLNTGDSLSWPRALSGGAHAAANPLLTGGGTLWDTPLASTGEEIQAIDSAWFRFPSVGIQGWQPSLSSLLPPPPPNVRTILEALLSPLSVSPSPLLSAILQDGSEQALRPANREALFGLIQAVSHAVESSIKPGTLKKDQQAWRHWLAFTAEMGTAAVRNDDPARAPRETFLVAAFIVWLTTRLKSSTPGRTFCKAKTYLGLCYAVKRNHVRHGKRFDCLAMAKAVVKALNTEYARREGPESLIPARREPFSRGIVRQLLSVAAGTNLHNRTCPRLEWGSWFGLNLKAMICVSASGAFRKAEVSLAAGVDFDAMHMSRASLFWIIDDVVVRCPSDAQLRALKEGDKAGLLACPAKNDPWGCFFMPHPLFFNFHSGQLDNTAAALRDLALGCPVAPHLMRSTPMFSSAPGAGPSARPMRHNVADATLRALLRTFMDEETASHYSWHSFRIGLACSLLAAGASESVILALCRWRSPESLRVYARFNRSVSAAWLDAAAGQTINSVQAPNLPAIAALGADGVPGALLPHVYAALDQVEQGDDGPTAAALLALEPPEIDAHLWVNGLNNLNFEALEVVDEADDVADDAGL